MTNKSKKALVRRRPDGLTLRDAIAQNSDPKGKAPAYSKSAVSMKTVEGSDLLSIDSMRPTDEQVEKINQFTRSEKTADQLLVFPTLSCNDMYDRDDEAFKVSGGGSAIKQMHELEAPYSFVGKSFMLDHDYTVSKGVGRIFDEEVTNLMIDSAGDVEFLKHWIYMPNTPQFQPIAEKMDFGVQWAVSVGIVMNSAGCTVCDSPVYNGRYMTFCYENGHEKGLWYDPDSDEKDDWGWAIPVEEGTDKAVKAKVDLYDPRDGYELSSVFLGAQYYAALEKDPNFKGVIKAASAGGVPIIGLSSKDAETLPFPHEHEAVREARSKYTVMVDDDGDPTWTDKNGLKWVYDSETDKVLSLVADDEEDDDGEEESGDGGTAPGEVVRSDGDEVEGGDDAVAADGGILEAGAVDHSDDGGEVLSQGDDPEEGLTEADAGESGEVKAVKSKAQLLDLAKEAGVPDDLITAAKSVQAVGERGALKAILSGLVKQNQTLMGMAGVGESYITSLHVEAIRFYTIANQDGTKGVDTETFQKMLNKFGDDVELLKESIEQQRKVAQSKFPTAVRRSSFESDHNDRDTGAAVPVEELVESSGIDRTAKTARDIHR